MASCGETSCHFSHKLTQLRMSSTLFVAKQLCTVVRMSRPLFVGSYLQITWWALGQWRREKKVSNDNNICMHICHANKVFEAYSPALSQDSQLYRHRTPCVANERLWNAENYKVYVLPCLWLFYLIWTSPLKLIRNFSIVCKDLSDEKLVSSPRALKRKNRESN